MQSQENQQKEKRFEKKEKRWRKEDDGLHLISEAALIYFLTMKKGRRNYSLMDQRHDGSHQWRTKASQPVKTTDEKQIISPATGKSWTNLSFLLV